MNIPQALSASIAASSVNSLGGYSMLLVAATVFVTLAAFAIVPITSLR